MTRSLRLPAIPGRAIWIEPLLRLLERRPPRLDRSSLSPHLLRDIGLSDMGPDVGRAADRSRHGPLDANWWER